MIYPYNTHSLSTTVASNNNPSLSPNPQSSKASEPINKPIMLLSIVKEEEEGEEDIIIVDKGIKKRSIPSDIISEKYKRPKSLTPINRLSDWIISDYQHRCTV